MLHAQRRTRQLGLSRAKVQTAHLALPQAAGPKSPQSGGWEHSLVAANVPSHQCLCHSAPLFCVPLQPSFHAESENGRKGGGDGDFPLCVPEHPPGSTEAVNQGGKFPAEQQGSQPRFSQPCAPGALTHTGALGGTGGLLVFPALGMAAQCAPVVPRFPANFQGLVS